MMQRQWLPVTVLSIVCLFVSSCGEQRIQIKPGWTISKLKYGKTSGTTSVGVYFPKAGDNLPLTFGIPLGQSESCDDITLFDQNGNSLPVSCIPLANWWVHPARWTLISTVVVSKSADSQQTLTIKWGAGKLQKSGISLEHTITNAALTIKNGDYTLVLSMNGIERLITQGKSADLLPNNCSITLKNGNITQPGNLIISVLHDSPLYKKFRCSATLTDGLDIHREYELWAGSPYVRCSTRYINRTLKDIPLNSISPVNVHMRDAEQAYFGVVGQSSITGEICEIHQRAFECFGVADGVRYPFKDDMETGVWAMVPETVANPGFMLVFPYFRGMAAGNADMESVVSCQNGTMRLEHYVPLLDSADVRIRETMARTFTCWLVVNSSDIAPDKLAEIACHMPHVIYDRQSMTEMGVLQEHSVSHLFDTQTLEGALYFTRAQVPRAEYPRCGRGTEPGDDGEGLYEVDLHAGGMVFGEVFQYFTPKPSQWHFDHYNDILGIPRDNIITGGKFSYRNGDIPLALFQEYLRTGNREVYDLAMIHSLLYADYAVSHADGLSGGVGHYYCDWYGNPYVYERFEGLLLGYLLTGNDWLFETAKSMADFTVRAWKDGHPHDAHMNGTLTGVQSRSAYMAKMNLKLYDMTGKRKYLNNAIDLAEWAMDCQEPEGWWVMNPDDRINSRAFRCTPIFTGYIVQGLWPLYWRTGNDELKSCLLRAADWYMSMQEDANGFNPGTFPNSYWYGTNGSEDNPVSPVRGNYATTSHAANALLQAYLASGDPKYFYGANAAWVGVLNHQTADGGIPLENTEESSVWSHVLIESLPHFAAVAEERGLPVVLSSRTGVPGTSYMGKGATWDGKTFTFELKYRHENPVPLRVFFPGTKPKRLSIDGNEINDLTYNESLHVVSIELPPSQDFHVCEMRVER